MPDKTIDESGRNCYTPQKPLQLTGRKNLKAPSQVIYSVHN